MRYLLLLLLFCSCMSEKKIAKICSEKYPVTASTVIVQGESRMDTTYIPGDTLVFSDTVRIDCDTVKGVITKTVYKEKACPPVKVIHDLRVDTFKVTQMDRAKEDQYRIEARDQTSRADRLLKGRDTWRWIAIVCLLMIGTAVFSKIKGFI